MAAPNPYEPPHVAAENEQPRGPARFFAKVAVRIVAIPLLAGMGGLLGMGVGALLSATIGIHPPAVSPLILGIGFICGAVGGGCVGMKLRVW